MNMTILKELQDQIKEFPCSFNLDCEEVRLSRLKAVHQNLFSELNNESDHKFDIIRKKNMLSWIYFQLEEHKNEYMPLKLCNEILELTEWRNIANLGNCYIIMWCNGDEEKANKCLNCLKNMKNEENFHAHFNEARAEQAYHYSKLGGFHNLTRAIDLYSELVEEVPDNYLWKYCLGVVIRRAEHPNIYFSRSKHWDVDKYFTKAMQYLFEVADKGEHPLKSLAYAELISRDAYEVGKYPECDGLFQSFNVHFLVNKALEDGNKMSSVLVSCGRALCCKNVDGSIYLLEKAVQIKQSSKSYHYLGKSYRRKSKLLARGTLQTRENRFLTYFEETDPGKYCQSTDGNVGKGRWPCPSRTISDQTRSSSYQSREESRAHRQLFNGSSVSRQDCLPTNRNWTSKMNSHFVLSGQDSSITSHYNTALTRSHHKQFNCWKNSDEGRRDQIYHKNWQRNYNLQGRSNVIHPSSSPSAHEANQSYKKEYNQSRNVTGLKTSPSKAKISACIRKPGNDYLNKDDEYVKKAVDCFKKAAELDIENFPALLDLGILIKETGEIQEALKQFNRITNSYVSTKHHVITVINAYEQAGLCYLELSKTCELDNGYEDKGKKKLTQAVALAADLALTSPELQESAQNLCTAFEALMNIIDGKGSSLNQLNEKVKLLELAKKHSEIVEVFQKVATLTGDVLRDKEIFIAAIKSYLSLGQPENALALQNIIPIRPDVSQSDWWNDKPIYELRVKVLQQAIYRSLSGINENPTILFQQVFKIVFGNCFGACDNEEQNARSRDLIGDVLIVFDDVEDESPGSTPASSHCLKLTATCLFGLEAEENIKRNFDFVHLPEETQLQEMKKYPVVIIVLGNETRSKVFDYMLKLVPRNESCIEPSNQRILVIDAGLRDGQVPLCLAQFECFTLQDIGGLGDISQILDRRDNRDQISYVDILTHVFHGDVNAVMKLFGFIIGHDWSSL